MNADDDLLRRLAAADQASPPPPGAALTVERLLARHSAQRRRSLAFATLGLAALAALTATVARALWPRDVDAAARRTAPSLAELQRELATLRARLAIVVGDPVAPPPADAARALVRLEIAKARSSAFTADAWLETRR